MCLVVFVCLFVLFGFVCVYVCAPIGLYVCVCDCVLVCLRVA